MEIATLRITDAPAQLIAHCLGSASICNTVAARSDFDSADVAGLVTFLTDQGEFVDHDSWVKIGMACRLSLGDDGFEVWRSTFDETVTEQVAKSKWNSFDQAASATSVTLGTWLQRAHALGWTGNIRRSSASMFAGVAQMTSPSIVPMAVGFDDLILSSGEFVNGFEPPEYVLDTIFQRRFCYSITGSTGTGKTCVAMLLTAHVSIGKAFAGLDVTQGAVIYFAGENPVDVQMRWLGLTRDLNIDPATDANVHFVSGAKRLSEIADRITAEVVRKSIKPALVVVDTAAAYNEGDDENSNTQAGDHARRIRSLTNLPGGPCVIVLCHPTKRAGDEDLVPRGGGAFLAEVDGNVALRKLDSLVTASVLGKFRGPDFSPISFELHTVRDHPQLKDARGRSIPTVIARAIDADDRGRIERNGRGDEDAVLRTVDRNPGSSPTDLARILNWKLRPVDGKSPLHHVKAKRTLERLKREKLVEDRRGGWFLTPKGQKELNNADRSKSTPLPTSPIPLPPIANEHARNQLFVGIAKNG